MQTHPVWAPRDSGFTLIEMLVVVVIVAILASAALPLAAVGEQRLKERELRHALREIRTAIDGYRRAVDEGRIVRKTNDSGYPPSLAVLVEGVPDVRSAGSERKIYLLRRIPADPFADPDAADTRTWGLRSYASAPTDPRPGDDVFDVYSLNPGVGSNGVPYRNW